MIRGATKEDIEQLTRVHVLSWQSAYRGLLPEKALGNINYQERQDMWAAAISQSPSETVVAVIDSNIVGFANFRLYREDGEHLAAGEIRAIYLLREYWNKGIGSQLLEYATNYLKNSCEVIFLWVLKTNQNAISFYENHGFIYDGIEKEESLWNVIVHEIRMSKAINS